MNYYEAITHYLMDNPGASSSDLAHHLDEKPAKAIWELNQLVDAGIVTKGETRSSRNNRVVIGYQLIPGFDEVYDLPTGEMTKEAVLRLLENMHRSEGWDVCLLTLGTLNNWRIANGVKPLGWGEVTRESPYFQQVVA
jgi:hypothetical protein